MGMSDLPELYAQSQRAQQAYILGKSQVPMLQLLCNTSVWLIALMPIRYVHWFLYIYMPERSDYGYATSNVVATIVIINGPVLRISQSQNFRGKYMISLFEDCDVCTAMDY